jgi:hypothetical protein
MGDDDKSKASAESLAEAEKEHRELMAAFLKKLDVLSSLEERLGLCSLKRPFSLFKQRLNGKQRSPVSFRP